MRPGSFDDPVARSIRNEQMRDAAPSPQEQEMMKEREEARHIQYKAIEYLLEDNDWPLNYDTVHALAVYFGFDELESLNQWDWDGMPRTPSYPEQHELVAERPDDPDLSPRFDVPAFDARYDVPSDPEEYRFIENPPKDVRCGEKIMNPFGAKVARVIAIEDDDDTFVWTNETYTKAFDGTNWSDSFDWDTIRRYRDQLEDIYVDTVHGGDD